ncbi:MAG: hypothetical protein IJ062_03470 [Firmicutes bacterium]|nr:hypothetical protein [Bacillota bacterium]
MKKIFLLSLLCLMFAGCSSAEKQSLKEDVTKTTAVETTVAETVTETTTESVVTKDEISAQIEGMSLYEKVGQMFIIDLADMDENFVVHAQDGDLDIKENNVGGFILLAKDINGVEGTKQLTAKLREISRIAPFIGIDEEGGVVSRVGDSGAVADYYIPSARSMANNGTVEENYTKIAKTLTAMGFNLDFAPDADVDTNPDNPIIGDRAFSNDAKTAGENAVIAMNALRENGVIPVIKHFPGHGDTDTDTHTGTAIVPHDRERLDSVELVPFRLAIENNAPMIMVAHVKTPAISNNDMPASVNHDIITGLLREELGFDGVIITDAMNMGAVTQYGKSQSIENAVKAGADIILMPTDIKNAFDTVIGLTESGEITEERIDESVYRILKLKENLK